MSIFYAAVEKRFIVDVYRDGDLNASTCNDKSRIVRGLAVRINRSSPPLSVLEVGIIVVALILTA
jgi:hypothetical protein